MLRLQELIVWVVLRQVFEIASCVNLIIYFIAACFITLLITD